MHLKNVVCLSRLLHIFSSITDYLSKEAISVDADQIAHTGAVWSGSTLFVKDASKTFQQTTKQMMFSYNLVFLRLSS